jgi:hypothetical protein
MNIRYFIIFIQINIITTSYTIINIKIHNNYTKLQTVISLLYLLSLLIKKNNKGYIVSSILLTINVILSIVILSIETIPIIDIILAIVISCCIVIICILLNLLSIYCIKNNIEIKLCGHKLYKIKPILSPIECPICLDIIQNTSYLTECNHTYCKECLDTWLKSHITCPVCRKSLYVN